MIPATKTPAGPKKMTSETDLNLHPTDQSVSREALDCAVAELYTAFARRTLSPDGPDVCTACCADPVAMARIASCAKDQIAFDDLSDFHSAAKGEAVEQDLAYLLPRTLDFVAQGREPKCAGMFSLFSHYFPPMWNKLEEKERAAVRACCSALTRWRLGLDAGASCDFTVSEILEMCASGGFDCEPVLDALTDPPKTETAVRAIADLLIHDAFFWRDNGSGFYDVEKDRAASIASELRAALTSPTVIALLEQTALHENNEDLATQASLAHQIAESLMAESGS